MKKILNTIQGLRLFLSHVRIFDPEKTFRNKKVAIIGAAETALEEENARFIESFDLVVRVNKALHTWRPEQEKYIGKRTDILFHSFFENELSGGGPVDFDLFQRRHGLKYLVHPRNSLQGWRIQLNFYKRRPRKTESFLLPRKFYKKMQKDFGELIPTVGYAALYSILNAPCREIYITGFTFFRTPYAPGYRDHFREKEANSLHIQKQGLHDPDLEFRLFLHYLNKNDWSTIHLDKGLTDIIEQERTS